MSNLTLNHKILMLPLIIAMASCNRPVKHAAEKAVPKTFASPSDAGAALLAAAQSGERTALLEIFGQDGQEILFTGDPARDKAGLRDFASAYLQMNRWGKIKAGGQTLYIGPDNYAFPIPLGQNTSGQWYFDTAAGKDEILARRIGRHELAAIAACESVARAQRLYFSQIHDHAKQYARKFVSDPGKQNGLYWPVTAGRVVSPLAQLGDFGKVVASNTGDRPRLFNGYYYRILAEPGDLAAGKMTRGFAILAYPAEYRNSGIMTFVVGQRGVVYQKDLGEKTGDVALAMTEFKAADSWTPAVPPATD
jgi:hypothetical protein